jgi:hypothetical protein
MPFPKGRKPLDNHWYKTQLNNHNNEVDKMNQHRRFMHNTCPASRHAQTIAESLMNHGEYEMLKEDPEHCAGAIGSVVSSLYQARSFLKSLGYDWRVLDNGDVQWYVNNSNDK